MKTPGPDHPITITPNARQVRVRFQDHVIAASKNVLTLQEANYPPVHYFPRADVETGFISKTTHHTECPYKGEASYFTLYMNGDMLENAVWSYEAPYPAMEQIKDMLAFYPNKFDVYEIDEADIADRHRPKFSEAWPAADSGAQ